MAKCLVFDAAVALREVLKHGYSVASVALDVIINARVLNVNSSSSLMQAANAEGRQSSMLRDPKLNQ